MKTNLKWLKEFVDIQMEARELAHALTMAGLEVEALEPLELRFDKILVGRITSVRSHPNAERLTICDVDAGGQVIQVVCGAPNVAEGVKAPLALPGAVLADGTKVKETKIRGIVSAGVLLAEDELGLTDDHTGIMTLDDNWDAGAPLASVMPQDDWVLEVAITPNRPDCASVIGIAREIAAITGNELKIPDLTVREEGPPVESLAEVRLIDDKGCPRYAARVIQDVRLGPSPFWMRYRLHLGGIRSINNIVDVTNYVLLELGQPLHAFDYDRLRGHRIEVKRAEQGMRFTTLDGQTRELNHEVLLICDGERPVALAGIMGGLNSEIFEGTKHVLLESAFFDPLTIRRGAKYLGLMTEASYRFERGIDIGGVVRAIDRAASLIQQIGGGRVAKGVLDAYPKKVEPPSITIRVTETNRLLGTDLSLAQMEKYLTALQMDVKRQGEEALVVRPPSFRVDLHREIDLVEEVARISGYENIPLRYPEIKGSEEGRYWEPTVASRARSVLTAAGYTEVITYSFISPRLLEQLGAGPDHPLMAFVRLVNPLSTDQSVMRTSLVPGLLQAAKQNLFQGEKGLKLFEWGKVFVDRGEDWQPSERYMVAGLLTGTVQPKKWYAQEREADFFDIKGAAEALLEAFGLREVSFRQGADFPGYDPDVSACVLVSGELVGRVGRLDRSAKEAYDLGKGDIYLFEMDMETLRPLMPEGKKFKPFARFPAVYRDISIIVSKEIESSRVEGIIRESGGGLVESVDIFDVYEGKGISPSEKALAFRVCYRSPERTLDGDEVNRLHETIIEEIKKATGGRLREG